MSLYEPFDFVTAEPAYGSSSAGMLQAGSGVIFPRLKLRGSAWRGHVAALLFTIVAAFFVFSLAAFISSLPTNTIASENSPVAAAVSAASAAQLQEIHIANNGLILLRGARVVSVNGTNITLGMSWGPTDFTWVVRTNASSVGTHDYGTRFIDRNGNKLSLANIQVGSLVTVTGMFGNDKVSTLDADTVRSLQ